MSKETCHLSLEKQAEFLGILEMRFNEHGLRHEGMAWQAVKRKIEASPEKLRSLYEMEVTGGEPDVVFHNEKTDEYVFVDCSAESPIGRRSVCYDREALDGRKANKPQSNAVDMALEMGIEILTEELYRELQTIGQFDLKTSSWVKTPDAVRKLGGAIFCDRRYNRVFVYHNGAESYYSARGFRGSLTL